MENPYKFTPLMMSLEIRAAMLVHEIKVCEVKWTRGVQIKPKCTRSKVGTFPQEIQVSFGLNVIIILQR
jgi:hypothetical protein